MNDIKLSIVIPSYKDPLLFKTIHSILDNSELGQKLEIIAVFDGYYPDSKLIIQDSRVKYVHLGANRGMRGAINAGILASRGEFIGRLDEHCSFGKGFDKILTESCKPNWIMTPKRFFLDPIKWELMDIPPVEHEKLVIQSGKKFSGARWPERDLEQKDVMVSESLGMQGSFWICPRKWFDDVCGGFLEEEGYGPTYQDSVEVTMKTLQAGGKLMVHKGTWFAHKHRSFSRTHREGSPENPSNREASWKYSLDTWREYFETVIRSKWKI